MFMRNNGQSLALSTLGFQPGHADRNAARAAELFAVRDFQTVNADIDNDGDEDQTAVRLLPLTGTSGQVLAAGASVDLELKPLKLFKGLNFAVPKTLADALAGTSFMVGQADMMVTKGAIAIGGLVAADDNDLLDMPWAGPGLHIYLTLKNISSAEITLYGAIRGLAVIG